MKAFILTYHSHHVVGTEYHKNDHIALACDLDVVTEKGFEIAPLSTLLDVLRARQGGNPAHPVDRRIVVLTFDDGPIFDVQGFLHPTFGPQPGFLRIMRRFQERHGADCQPGLGATSFVIASAPARRRIEETFDAEYTYLESGALSDTWWGDAIGTGLLTIGNHSWDHLHPALEQVAHSAQARADFTRVASFEDANAQIAVAARYIAEITQGAASPYFAYPFGHYNRFLTETYLPGREAETGVCAALSTIPKPVTPDDSIWCLPRYVCGHDWKSPAELMAILSEQPD